MENMKCPTCSGTCTIEIPSFTKICCHCNGTDRIQSGYASGYKNNHCTYCKEGRYFVPSKIENCRTCEGTGWISALNCKNMVPVIATIPTLECEHHGIHIYTPTDTHTDTPIDTPIDTHTDTPIDTHANTHANTRTSKKNDKYLECGTCKSTGLIQFPAYRQSCYQCSGSGRIYSGDASGRYFYMCPACNGGYRIVQPKNETCVDCKGTGYVHNHNCTATPTLVTPAVAPMPALEYIVEICTNTLTYADPQLRWIDGSPYYPPPEPERIAHKVPARASAPAPAPKPVRENTKLIEHPPPAPKSCCYKVADCTATIILCLACLPVFIILGLLFLVIG